MSYSRWSNSIWYTFWSTNSCKLTFKLPIKKLKRCQVFEVLYTDFHRITYGEIMDKELNKILEEINEYYSNNNINKHHLDELGGYIKIFIQDVNNHFKWINFFKHEWFYPLKHRIFIFKK